MAHRDLAQGDLGRRIKRLEDAQRRSGLNSASIGRGGLRVHSGGVITIENGGLRVTGTAEIIGTLIASGLIEFSGEVNISGPLDISGLTQIMGDLQVLTGGKITAGSITLNPDGSAKFGTMAIDPTGKITSGQFVLNPDGSAKFGDLLIGADGTITSGSATINPDGSATFGVFEIAANGDLASKGALSIEGPTTLKNDLTVDQLSRIILGGLVLENQGAATAAVQMPGGGISADTVLGMLINHDTVTIAGQSMVKIDATNLTTVLPTKAGVVGNVYCDPSTGQLFRAI